jgi:hypothetical protein
MDPFMSNFPPSPNPLDQDGYASREEEEMSETASSGSLRHQVPLTTFASDTGSITDDDSSVEVLDSTASQPKSPSNSGTTGKHRTAISTQKTPTALRPTGGGSQEYSQENPTAFPGTSTAKQMALGQEAFLGNPEMTAHGKTQSSPPANPAVRTLVLPELQVKNTTTSTTYYKYRAQLTFGLKPSNCQTVSTLDL